MPDFTEYDQDVLNQIMSEHPGLFNDEVLGEMTEEKMVLVRRMISSTDLMYSVERLGELLGGDKDALTVEDQVEKRIADEYRDAEVFRDPDAYNAQRTLAMFQIIAEEFKNRSEK